MARQTKPRKVSASFVIASGDAPIALDSFEEVFYLVTMSVEPCGEWHSRSAATATWNAGVYSFPGRCLPERRAIIGFVTNEGRIFRQALRELFCPKRCRLGSHPDTAITTACERALTMA